MNKLNNSMMPLVLLSVVLSLSAIIAVAAHWPDRGVVVTTAAAAPRQPAALKTVHVVMHDPGCHWFQTDAGLKQSMTIHGPVSLMNMDEAALSVAGANGSKIDHVGSNMRLGPGTYRITMVGQAPDDNHLKLVVN